MKDLQYNCTGCSFKSTTSQGLIGKGRGCASCGKSGYKCPRCGMPIKIRKAPSYTVAQALQTTPPKIFKKIETGKTGQSGRKFNIKRS